MGRKCAFNVKTSFVPLQFDPNIRQGKVFLAVFVRIYDLRFIRPTLLVSPMALITS